MSCLLFSSLSYTLTNIYLIVSVAAANVEGYIRDTSLAEDAVGNVKWSLKTILTVDQIGKVQCDGCCRLDACCIWESNHKSHQPWYVYPVVSFQLYSNAYI